MEKFIELINHIDFIVISNSATQLAELPDFEDKVLLNLIKLWPDELESVEVPLLTVCLQIDNFFFKFLKLAKNSGNFEKNRLLALLAIFQIPESLVLKEAIDE